MVELPTRKSFGRKWNRPSLEFGEKIYIREAKKKDGRMDWEPMSVAVRFVGYHARTNAMIGLSEDGLKLGQAVKRLSKEQRWTKEGLDELVLYSWVVKSRSGVSSGTHVKAVELQSRETDHSTPAAYIRGGQGEGDVGEQVPDARKPQIGLW